MDSKRYTDTLGRSQIRGLLILLALALSVLAITLYRRPVPQPGEKIDPAVMAEFERITAFSDTSRHTGKQYVKKDRPAKQKNKHKTKKGHTDPGDDSPARDITTEQVSGPY